jgi:antitoxin MazE
MKENEYACQPASRCQTPCPVRFASFANRDKAPLLVYIQCRYMATTTQLSKWGNSLGLRLPKSIAREVQLGEGDTVQVSVDNGTIVIRPSRPRYSLDELVRRITPKNRHDESDWRAPLGNEAW